MSAISLPETELEPARNHAIRIAKERNHLVWLIDCERSGYVAATTREEATHSPERITCHPDGSHERWTR